MFTVRSDQPGQPAAPGLPGLPGRSAPGLFPEGYREVSYEEDQTYAGRKGAVVFEYEAVRAAAGSTSATSTSRARTWGYNVEFIVPADQWDASQDLARQFEQAFQPLG